MLRSRLKLFGKRSMMVIPNQSTKVYKRRSDGICRSKDKKRFRHGDPDRAKDETCCVGQEEFDSLYTFRDRIYTGNRQVSVSPDGSIVIMDGSYYAGTSMLRTANIVPDEVVSSIYVNGELAKEVHFASDLNRGYGIPWFARDFLGGWVKRENFIAEVEIDWSASVIIYSMVVCPIRFYTLPSCVRNICCRFCSTTRAVVIQIPSGNGTVESMDGAGAIKADTISDVATTTTVDEQEEHQLIVFKNREVYGMRLSGYDVSRRQ